MQQSLFKIGISILLLTTTLLSFSSCVREYTCRCEVSYTGKPGLPASNTKEYTIKNSEKNAKSLCSGASKTYSEMGITTTEACDLY